MKTTNYFLFTSKNNISDNVVYNLMFRGGIIRRLSSGIYILLPNGLRVLNNIIYIIKEELSKLDSIEILLPVINSCNIWKKSGRFFNYGDELFKLYDRNKKLFILSPTHEEVISKIICENIINYCEFPKIFYQIQIKFRDEIRSVLGLNRTKEFFMKDAYSFHKSCKCLNKIYYLMLNIYSSIFKKLGLNVYCKKADSGNIGGSLSHEFHVLSYYGEDKINLFKYDVNYSYSYFVDKSFNKKHCKYKKIKLFYLKNNNNKISLNKLLNINKFVKTYLIKMVKDNEIIYIFVLLPYKKELCLKKIRLIYLQCKKIEICNNDEIFNMFGVENIFLGPWNLEYLIIADNSLINFKNFIIGSNMENSFYVDVNWNLNIKVNNFFFICKNTIIFLKKKENKLEKYKEYKSVEIAHLFKLKEKYTSIFCKKNNKLNKNNLYMGCYGIGLTRLLSVIIDNYHDNKGIIWPNSIANFKIGLIPVNMYNNNDLMKLTYDVYNYLLKFNIDVLLDDRKLHIGSMITDFELIGIPNLIILSKKTLLTGLIEYKNRLNNYTVFIDKKEILSCLVNIFSK